MSDDVRRTQYASKKKMMEAVKKRTHPDRPSGPQFRNTPAGRRLAALKKKKQGDS